MLFAPFRIALFTGIAALLAAAPVLAADQTALPAGGKYKDCHGYIRHVSSSNIRVHCIDGTPADLSFLYIPKYANVSDGKSVQTKDLKPETPVHVIFTQSLGLRKAYKIFVADPSGKGIYGFKS
ncbi:MAG: hypothetical protein NVS2B17_23890 [Candidatus Velthaea sp.]